MDGFEGKLTSSKWAKIAKCSQDTATRDIQDLVATICSQYSISAPFCTLFGNANVVSLC